MNLPGFKRLYHFPRIKRYNGWQLYPRDAWRLARSQERFARRTDAYLTDQPLLFGEIGRVENFRFILSPI